MLTKYTNDYGAITLDEGLIYQMFYEAIRPWETRARYVGGWEVRFSEGGLFAAVSISIRIGSSISEICRGIIDYVAASVSECLQMDIDDIVINVVQMTTQRAIVKRDIRISYRGSENEEDKQ